MHTRTTTSLAAAAALAATALVATPAVAGPDNGKGARFDISDHGAGTIVATCADGGTVTGPMDGEAVMHEVRQGRQPRPDESQHGVQDDLDAEHHG